MRTHPSILKASANFIKTSIGAPLIILALVILFPFQNSLAAARDPNAQPMGLDAISNPTFDQLLVASDATLPKQRKIYIDPVETNFASTWLSRFRSETNRNYRDDLLREYKQMLASHLKDKLTARGWLVLDSPSREALTMKPRLKDLYIEGPNSNAMTHMIVSTIGHSTFELIVEDINHQAIMKIVDRRTASTPAGFAIETNRAINSSRFNILMDVWAINSAEYLGALMDVATNSSE